MFKTSEAIEDAYCFSRYDLNNPLASCSNHPIVLEEKNWTTCEHYVQSKIVRSNKHAEIIEKLPTAEMAIHHAKPWYRSKIKDYQKIAPLLMTRALYTKLQMYDEVKEALNATKQKMMIETSQYDYFWGIGRDQRGANHLGKIWMDIRKKASAANS